MKRRSLEVYMYLLSTGEAMIGMESARGYDQTQSLYFACPSDCSFAVVQEMGSVRMND